VTQSTHFLAVRAMGIPRGALGPPRPPPVLPDTYIQANEKRKGRAPRRRTGAPKPSLAARFVQAAPRSGTPALAWKPLPHRCPPGHLFRPQASPRAPFLLPWSPHSGAPRVQGSDGPGPAPLFESPSASGRGDTPCAQLPRGWRRGRVGPAERARRKRGGGRVGLAAGLQRSLLRSALGMCLTCGGSRSAGGPVGLLPVPSVPSSPGATAPDFAPVPGPCDLLAF